MRSSLQKAFPVVIIPNFETHNLNDMSILAGQRIKFVLVHFWCQLTGLCAFKRVYYFLQPYRFRCARFDLKPSSFRSSLLFQIW